MSEELTEFSSTVKKVVKSALEEKEKEKRDETEKFFSYSSWAESFKDSSERQKEDLWKLFEKKEQERRKSGYVVNRDFDVSEQFEIFGSEESAKEKQRRKQGTVGFEQELEQKQKRKISVS